MKFFSIFIFIFFVLCLEAETFALKLPIPCTVDIESKNGFWEIRSQFNATRSFPADLSKKIDRKHAEHICYAALKKIYKIKTGNITFSGLQVVTPPKYDQKKVSFSFKIPQASIKIVKYKTDNSKKSKTDAFYPKEKKQKTSVAKKSTSTTESVAIAPSLIDDVFLENLELSGYHIRVKKDLQQAISIFSNTFYDLSADMDWEAFEKSFALLQEVSEFEIQSVLFNDNRILQSDAEAIYAEINSSKKHLINNIKTKLNKTIPIFEKEFYQFRKEQVEALKTATNDKDKNDLNEALIQIDRLIKQLKRIKKYVNE